jgi:hypothetical protein
MTWAFHDFGGKTRLVFLRPAAAGIVSLLACLAVRPATAAILPYTADAATLHLWHLDEASTPCVDSAPGGTNLAYLIGGATLGNASYSNSAVNFTNCISFGTLTTPAAVIFPGGSANVGTAIPFTYAGASGAFTYEALVHVEFNPTNNYSINPPRNQPFQIMDCDADGPGTRVFQLRLDPVGFVVTGASQDTNVVGIEFINGINTIAVVPIPTNGPDAIVSNAWYHVAVTYNGTPNTTSNLLFYWTLLDSTRTNADCLYGTNMTSDLPGPGSSTTVFSLGNSARNPGGGSGADAANFLGKIDEVRISSVARAAGQMLFVPTGIAITSQPSPTNQLVGTGQSISYSVTASGSPLNYQWWHNGSAVTNATNSMFTIASAQPSDSGNYDVLVTNNFYAATSIVVSVTVTNLAIIAQPVSVTTGYAGTATFSVTAVGEQTLFYQWWQNGNPVAGATNSTLTFSPLIPANAGNYYVVVSNSLASLTSTMATLTLNGPQVTLTPAFDGTNAAASGYAYAGSSDINAVSFICSGLMTVGSQQFFAYYGQHQSNPAYAYNGTIWIARRTVGTNVWQIFRTAFTPDDITDGHDVVCFGIDGGGYMHLSWGMHDQNLHYARSTAPVTGSQPIAFGSDLGADGMTGIETSVTYPQFLTMPNGDLLFLYRVGASGGGNTWLNHWVLASQTWTNVNLAGGTPSPFIQGLWPATNYNAYPNMPCLDANGDLYLAWTWRETPAYESNNNLLFAKSTDGGVTWQRFNGTFYDLPISQGVESGDPNAIAQVIVPIPQNYSLINQAGMCLDASNNPVIATWWAPGSPTNYQRQYMVVFPDTNGVWQTRQISNRTNDPPGTMELDAVVRDLGRPVVVCDQQNRVIVLYRDNFGSNGLTVAYSLTYAMDPQRTNWTTVDLTADNLGNYEPVIDLARWQRDNIMDIVYQASDGEGYTAPTNNASPIGVLEWNAAAYFNHAPVLQIALTNLNQDVVLSWNSQPGWGYQVQWSTNLVNWNLAATLNSISGFSSQYVQTNGAAGPQQFWRLRSQQGGF